MPTAAGILVFCTIHQIKFSAECFFCYHFYKYIIKEINYIIKYHKSRYYPKLKRHASLITLKATKFVQKWRQSYKNNKNKIIYNICIYYYMRLCYVIFYKKWKKSILTIFLCICILISH